MYGREDLHRLFVGIYVGDLLVHVEQVTVTLFDDILAQTLDRGLEIEEHGQPRFVHAEARVTTLFGGTRRHVARHEVTEGRITALQVVVTVLFGNIRRFLGTRTEGFHILDLFGNPDTAVVTQRLRH